MKTLDLLTLLRAACSYVRRFKGRLGASSRLCVDRINRYINTCIGETKFDFSLVSFRVHDAIGPSRPTSRSEMSSLLWQLRARRCTEYTNKK
jgi:hypothetical protein